MAEMESFLKTTTKMMQVQVEVIDRKIEKEIVGLRKDLRKEIIDKVDVIGSRLEKLDGTVDNLEKLNAKYREKEWVAREDFDKFLEEFKKIRGVESNRDVDLDEIRAFAKKVVQVEIEKHAADGLGMVDYALATGGAMVVKHSEPYVTGKLSSSWFQGSDRNGVHNIADKMLRPSLGEPGECFPLKGSSGFFIVRLRTAIIPEAVTLEHVAKSVAYDRSSAPKDCKVSGWLGSITSSIDDVADNVIYLTEFTYDLERSNAQTFNILSEGDNGESSRRSVDTIRLDFTSNHGSLSHTCVYRFRVHGYEP
jgi:SUN domain-containing protein 1/2